MKPKDLRPFYRRAPPRSKRRRQCGIKTSIPYLGTRKRTMQPLTTLSTLSARGTALPVGGQRVHTGPVVSRTFALFLSAVLFLFFGPGRLTPQTNPHTPQKTTISLLPPH